MNYSLSEPERLDLLKMINPFKKTATRIRAYETIQEERRAGQRLGELM
jgi:hypothetical protein